MDSLDNLSQIKALDKGNYLSSIEALPEQCRQTWQEVGQVEIPASYREVEKIVINGMGGSAFGGLVAKSVYRNQLKVPLEIINSYSVPAYVNEKTLFIFSSYSGTTEEVLATVDEVLSRGAKGLGITTGGRLAEILSQKQIPYFKINPQFNPSGQPRSALGYAILGTIGLLKKTGVLSIEDAEIQAVMENLNQTNQTFGVGSLETDNPAKKLARSSQGKVVILVGAEFLAGSTHIFRNQLNETAKNFADFYLLPELNHHLMDGLSFPKTNTQNLTFLFFDSSFYSPKIGKRMAITKDVVTQNKIPVLSFECLAEDRLSQAFEAIQFGSFVSFYLAMLNGVDPSVIPWVDYFKEKMS